MVNYAKHLTNTPQTQPAPGKVQVRNAAGGYVFKIPTLDAFRRFLILGSEGGTYYVSEAKLTTENVTSLESLLRDENSWKGAIDLIEKVSHEGLAARNKPALFALAYAAAFAPKLSHSIAVRQEAFMRLPKVARTLTDLYYFFDQYRIIKGTKGLGRAARRAVGTWFAKMPLPKLEEQAMKFRQREGWAAIDLIRLSRLGVQEKGTKGRPEVSKAKDDVIQWMKNVRLPPEKRYIPKSERLRVAHRGVYPSAETPLTMREVAEYKLPREVIPDDLLKERGTWETLLLHMPLHALVRNLNRMTIAGVPASAMIEKLGDQELIQKSRLHPLTILMAMHTYAQGRGALGSLTWTPASKVTDALNDAFYLAAKYAPRIKKPLLVGIDDSGSMGAAIGGYVNLSAAQGAAALAMSIGAITDEIHFMRFTTRASYVDLSHRRRLDDVMKSWGQVPEGTDAEAPIRLALKKNERYAGIILITDNESWAGGRHVFQGLKIYRNKFGPTKFISVATTATGTSVGDPDDLDTLNVVGFDASLGNLISNFME